MDVIVILNHSVTKPVTMKSCKCYYVIFGRRSLVQKSLFRRSLAQRSLFRKSLVLKVVVQVALRLGVKVEV